MKKLKKSVHHNLLRIALVEAIIEASNCNQRWMCSCEYCADMIHLSDKCGIDFQIQGDKGLVHLLPALIGRAEKDALSVLSIQHTFQSYMKKNIFDGFMEFPEGAYEAYLFFQEHRHEYLDDNSLLKRQTEFILFSLALPDIYFDYFANQNSVSDADDKSAAWDE